LGENRPGDLLVWAGADASPNGAWTRVRPPRGDELHHVLYWDAKTSRWRFISDGTEDRQKLFIISQNGRLTTLVAPSDEGTFVLTSKNGAIGWTATVSCEDELEEIEE
jgi:hypothetical protein